LRRPARRNANQIAIARAAGVSVSTVSRALSDAPGISDERRSQIKRLAREAGYHGRTLEVAATGKLLTYVTATIATGGLAPFYDSIVKGLVESARAAGLALAVRLVDESVLDLKRLLRDTSVENPVATMLVGIDPSAEIANHFADHSMPLILINGYDPEMRYDCVAANNFFGGAQATRQLLDAGHRSLLYIEDHVRWTTIQRRRGFLAALDAAQPDARGAILAIAGNRAASLAEEMARRQRHEADWTAIFAVNDMTAIRVIGALEAHGFRVPADVSVIGFDDLPYASMMNPALSTMAVDCALLGRQAIALLLRRLAEPDAGPLQVECGVSVRVGATIAQMMQT
jgi:DNA-binding LacI/PurR family transcriptional regulator